MTSRMGAQTPPDRAGIFSRPGVARMGLATPPGEGAPLAEGADSRVTPTPTRPRVIIPLSEADSPVAEGLPRRHGWRVDNINSAPDAETALRRMFEWARAELAKCEESRPDDADAFRWQLIHRMTPLVSVITRSHPAPAFRSHPKLSGGGWTPRRPRTRSAEARQP